MRRAARCGGFTLAELLAVLAIIAILSLMALPSFFEGQVRQQVKEALALAEVAKQGVVRAYGATGEMPAGNEAAGIPESGKIVGNYVTGVSVDHGAVTLTFGNNCNKSLAGKRLTLRPAVVEGQPAVPIAWLCGNLRTPDGMTAKGQNLTDLPPLWLPVACRA